MKNQNFEPRSAIHKISRKPVMIFITLAGIILVVFGLAWFARQQGLLAAQPGAANPGTTTTRVATNTAAPTPSPTVTTSPTPSASTTPAASPTASQQQISQQITDLLDKMSPVEKTGQMILMGVSGKEVTPEECQMIKETRPGGIVFNGGNISDPPQLRQLIADLKKCAEQSTKIPLLFALDHEGQYINRFTTGGSTIFPSAQAVGATGSPNYAYQVALASGQELYSFGINMILGPVADVLTDPTNTVIGDRSFGSDPQRVGEFVAQAVQGYSTAGLIPVLKHFPGHGSASMDSHKGLPVDNTARQTLFIDHFPPFVQGMTAGAQVVMMGHIALSQIDPSNMPASLSAPIIDILRNDLGFKGLILTDALDMGALKSTGLEPTQISLAAVQAGEDMLLILSPADALNSSLELQKAITHNDLSLDRVNESTRRILTLKAQKGLLTGYPAPKTPDFEADKQLAYQVGYHAVAELRDQSNLSPIPADVKSILLLAPPDNWGINNMLSTALQAKGLSVQVVEFPAPWLETVGDDTTIQDLSARAGKRDLTIILVWQALTNRLVYNDGWQGKMVRAIQKTGARMIVVGLRSPTDILEFPTISTFLVTFGTTPGQLQALTDIITGKTVPSGVNPLPQLP